MKHTQGPWFSGLKPIKSNHFEHGQMGQIFAYGPSRFRVADVVGPSNIEAIDTIIANTRLISAAPDLLEACKDALLFIRWACPMEEVLPMRIEKAIAKATE